MGGSLGPRLGGRRGWAGGRQGQARAEGSDILWLGEVTSWAMRLAVLRPRGATCLCAGAASIELTVLAIGSVPPAGVWLLDGPAARRS